MNNYNAITPENMQKLLNAAAAKLGTSPDQLKAQLESGKFDSALSALPTNEAAMLNKALSDKATCEKILNSPQAQSLFKKLGSL